MGLGHLVLGRRSVPEAKCKDVIALGTFATASAWSRSQFKSGDVGQNLLPGVSILGLISRPSSNIFFQTFILLALIGGTYVPCIISLLPDKKRETYDVLFGLIHDYLDRNNLLNKFEKDFFMTDFKVKEATKLG